MVPVNHTPAVRLAIQPRTALQPVIQLRKTEYLGGASMKTQWYCPPEVGAIDANSARDAAVASAPIQQKMKP